MFIPLQILKLKRFIDPSREMIFSAFDPCVGGEHANTLTTRSRGLPADRRRLQLMGWLPC